LFPPNPLLPPFSAPLEKQIAAELAILSELHQGFGFMKTVLLWLAGQQSMAAHRGTAVIPATYPIPSAAPHR
jgi:hypothetical protein